MHSPKKASPPKVGEASKSIPKSDKSVKSGDKKVEIKSEVNQKTYNYKPADNLKFQNTNEIFDIKVERNGSAMQSPFVSPKQNIIEESSVAKSNVVSSSPKSSGLHLPTPSQSTVRQGISANNQSNLPKTPSQSIIPQPPVSPRNKATQPV